MATASRKLRHAPVPERGSRTEPEVAGPDPDAGSRQATPTQISLAWMINKKPWIVPIPGTTNLGRMKENGGAADIVLTPEEVQHIDDALDHVAMSAVFGGTAVEKK